MEARELLQFAANHLGNRATDSGVHLVEDHRRYATALRLEAFERQHHARELAARGDSEQRHRGLTDVGGQMKFDRVDTERTKSGVAVHKAGILRGERAEARLETRRAHSERLQFGLHLAAEVGGGAL